MSRRPDLFIIGANKSGTTSLYEYLKGHPQVFMSPFKEPWYFAPDLGVGVRGTLRYGTDRERYLALFDAARDEKRLGEASTAYIYSRQAPKLIHEFQPRPWIVAMLRNPVDMIYAMHHQRVSEGFEDITDFEDALAADDDRRQGRRLPAGINVGAGYLDHGHFAEQLTRWDKIFGRERLHVILFDDLVQDTVGTFRKVLEFLEVDATYRPDAFLVHNRSHRRRSGAVWSVLRGPVPQWTMRRLLPRVIGQQPATELVRRLSQSRMNRVPAPRPPMRPELRRRLEEEFAPDVAALGDFLGRDLAELWWKRDIAGGGA